MVAMSHAEPPASPPANVAGASPPASATVRPRKTSEQFEDSVTELARRMLSGTAFHIAGLTFVELRIPGADGLPRALVLSTFLGLLAIRILGLYLALRRRGAPRDRLRVIAVGAIGTNLVWGIRTAAVHLHCGASEPSILMLVIMCGLTTGAMTAFAPSLWLQRAAQTAMFAPIVITGAITGLSSGGSSSLAVLYAMFCVYIIARGGVAHGDYWDSVHTNELLRRHAASAERAAIAADAAAHQLRAEIAHSTKVEAELRQAQKLEAIGRLAGGIAHEINTPLQFISDSCRFLGEGVGELIAAVDDVRRTADQVPGFAASLAQIDEDRDVAYLRHHLPAAASRALDGLARVGKIVAATKGYSAVPVHDRAATDLNDLIRSTITLSTHEVRYIADVATELGDLPAVRCHTGELHQAILNIVINAAHAIADTVAATGGRGTIRIKTWTEPGWVRISIADTGPGIPAEILDKIFEPFFTTKPVGKGTGHGLSVARAAIVHLHGGTLDVRSAPGAGSIFTIGLPHDP
jgi:signal transduction histidine kinase